MMAGFAGTTTSRRGTDGASTQTSQFTTTTSLQPGVTIPGVAPGASLTGETPCPAEDGSSPRTTTFAGPPPMCIEPDFFYTARITTSVGDLVMNINPHQAPQAANNFIVLSRYHFYDGQPISGIMPRMAFAVRAAIESSEGTESPGYTLPSEAPAGGQAFMFGSVAMAPVSETSTDFAAAFVVATYESATSLPQELTQFGFVVEGDDTVLAIDESGNAMGQPTKLITIDSIAVTKGAPIGVTGG